VKPIHLETIGVWFACRLTRKIIPNIQRNPESNECTFYLESCYCNVRESGFIAGSGKCIFLITKWHTVMVLNCGKWSRYPKWKIHVRNVYLAGQLAGVGPVVFMHPDWGAVSEYEYFIVSSICAYFILLCIVGTTRKLRKYSETSVLGFDEVQTS